MAGVFATIITLLLAAAIPGTNAWGYEPKKDLCNNFTYEIYRKDLVNESNLVAKADAQAVGKNARTYVSQWAFTTPNLVDYTAYLSAYTKSGYILLYNSGSGYVVDCDKVKELEFVEVKGKDCVYEVDYNSRVACNKAIGHWSGHAYGYGKATGEITTNNLEVIGVSATSQTAYATGT